MHISIDSRLFALGIPLVAISAPVRAETKTLAAPVDYTAALRQLADLGVPDLTGARWVSFEATGRFNTHVHSVSGIRQDEAEVREVFGPVAMHGWVTPAGVMLPGNLAFLDPNDSRANSFSGVEKSRELLANRQVEQSADLPVADLSKDLDGLIKRLEAKAAEFHKKRAKDSWSAQALDSQEAAITGRSLVFAAQILRAGDAASANRLADAVFRLFLKRQTVLNSAVSIIADSRYRSACEVLKKTGDWALFADALKALQKDFPRGWETRFAVAKLFSLVEARSADAPKLTLPAGVAGDAATLAAFDALGAAGVPSAPLKPGMTWPSGALWLLPAPPEQPGRPGFGGSGGVLDVPEVKALTKSGFAALPVLTAALGDETLTPFFRADNGGIFFGANESSESKALRLFNALDRPLTRGEIARALLLQVVPGDEYKLARMELASFAAAVETFRAGHEKSSPVELASLYLNEGSYRQKQAAKNFLSTSEDPAAGKIFEEYLLESGDIEGRVTEAIEYIRSKRGKSTEFAQKLLVKLKERLALPDKRPEDGHGSESSNGVIRRSRQALEEDIRFVEMLASGKTPREMILDAVVKPSEEALPLLNTLSPFVREMSVTARVSLFLEAACAAKDAGVKSRCVSQLAVGFRMSEGESPEKYALPAPGSVEAGRWLELLNDDKAKVGGLTIGAFVAIQFESMFEEVPPSAMGGFSRSDGNVGGIFLRRAKARLEGRPVPAYPDPSKVSAERLKAIVEGVSATPDDKLDTYLAGLNDDECAAWGVWWSIRRNPEFARHWKVVLPEVAAPAALIERETRLGSASLKMPYSELSEEDKAYTKVSLSELGLAPGSPISFTALDALCVTLAKDTAKYSGSVFSVSRGKGLGFSFYAHREKIAPLANYAVSDIEIKPDRMFAMQVLNYAQRFTMDGESGYKGSDAIVVLQAPRAGQYRDRVWRVKAGKVTPPEALDAKADATSPSMAEIVVLTAKDAAILVSKKNSGGAKTGPSSGEE